MSHGVWRTCAVKRTLASLLLLLIGFPLIGPALFAGNDAEANLPACCRRDGKHHCSMMDAAERQESGPALTANRCPQFPKSSLASESSKTFNADVSTVTVELAPAGCESLLQFSQFVKNPYNPSVPKRGPPSPA